MFLSGVVRLIQISACYTLGDPKTSCVSAAIFINFNLRKFVIICQLHKFIIPY